MLRAQRQAVYLVRKGNKEMVVEHYRTPDGRSFIVIHKSLEGSYETSDGDVKEWRLLELEDFKEVKDTPVDFETLPPEIRKAVSLIHR